MTDRQRVQPDVSRRSMLKVIAAASTAMVLNPPLGATAKAYAEEIGVPLRGPDGRVIVFHPPMASGIPLGGMGAGTFELRADGGMYEWQIFNNWAQRLVLPDTFFAVRANENAKPAVTRRLETIRHGNNPGTPVKNITYEGRSPIARLRYDEPALPVEISLTAWSPLIPHQPRESGFPAAVFTFQVTNRAATAVHACVLGSIRNAVALNNGWTGTQNRLERPAAISAVHMSARSDAKPSEVSKPVRVLVLLESMPSRVMEVLTNTKNMMLDTSVVVNEGPVQLPFSTAEELVKHYDVIWLGEIPHASATLGKANMAIIRDAVHQGAGLLVTGGWDSFYGNSGTRWGHLNATPIEQALPIEFCHSVDTVGKATPIVVAKKAHFVLGEPQVETLAGYNRIAAVKPGGEVLLKTADGNPLLITGQYGAGRTAVWATSVGGGWPPKQWTQMPMFYAGLLAHLGHARFTPGYGVDPFDASSGDMTFAALTSDALVSTQWRDARAFWSEFEDHGSLLEQQVAPDDARNAGLACAMDLAPGESKTATFILAWHFPNQYDYSRNSNFLGHMYSRWFRNSLEVIREMARRHEELFHQTEAFQNALYDSSMPPKIKDAVNAQLTTLNKETWWVKDGTFAVWEGMGCCGLQTLDVAFYGSHPISLLFPHQQKTSMRLTARHQRPDGEMPHFFPGTFEHPDAWFKIDLMPAFALMVYRDYLWSGDHAYLREMWPVITKAMAYDQRTDKNKDFLPDDHGPDSTFDGWPMDGTTCYVSSIFLAALAAGIRMAQVLGDTQTQANYTLWLEKGKKSFESELWNGQYYQMAHDIDSGAEDTGILLAGTVGQWYADICDLGDILPRDHVKRHNEAVFHYCRHKTRPGMPYVNPHDGIAYINGFWPHGGTPEGEGQWSGPWTGMEYMFAATLANLGRTDLAVTVTTDVYNRYVHRRAPWDHIECGEHYFRPLSVWTVLLALQGFRWDAIRRSLGFTPRISEANHRSLFCTAAGWGEYFAQSVGGRRMHRVVHRAGKLALSELTIGLTPAEGTDPTQLRVTCDGQALHASGESRNGRMVVSFKQPLRLKPGSALEVSWASNHI